MGARGWSLLLLGVLGGLALASQTAPSAEPANYIRLATTTSVEDTGLTLAITQVFQASTGLEVRVVAGGTGRTLALGAAGEVDVVLAHDPAQEMEAVAKGGLIERQPLMWNYFVLLGPPQDPAGAGQAPNLVEGFRRVARAGEQGRAVFVSRGDQSGTHGKEQELWRLAGVSAEGRPWLKATGQGMGPTLKIADELGGYVLSVDANVRTFRGKSRLVPLTRPDKRMINRYSVLLANPAHHPHMNQSGARCLVEWLLGPRGQAVIAGFGQPDHPGLFMPVGRASPQKPPRKTGHCQSQ
ncbi:MAG: substrate-binding domain-containing protein [Deltaproteobacteria bacterium]|nr:substrate-binding domain-containing protein [Deltaproteobacteria bacterium]